MEKSHESRIRTLADRLKVAATVDVVMIVLPHDLHHPVGMECLAAGKHVLMEKPLAVSEAECLELIRAAEDAERVLMTAYVMRYHPLVRRMKELIEEKACGDIFQVSIWTEQHTRRPQGDWYNTRAGLGGGQFFSHGCHYIDILLWYLGRPLRGTHLGTNFGTPWMEAEGTSNVTIEFADGPPVPTGGPPVPTGGPPVPTGGPPVPTGGPLGYHFGTWGARGTRLGYSIHAHGTEGMLEAHFKSGRLIAHRPKGREQVLLETEPGKQSQHQLEHFADCIEKGLHPITDGPGSLQGLRVIWRLYEAERRGVVADLSGLGLDEPWQRPGLDRLPG